jgi:hypothetical protein
LLKDKATGDHPGTPTSSKADEVELEKGITSHHARLSSISTGYSPGTSVPQR